MKTMDSKGGPSTPSSVPTPNLKRRGVGGFAKDVRAELKKVTWPAHKETTRLTGVVLVVCVLGTVILGGLSYGFEQILIRLFR